MSFNLHAGPVASADASKALADAADAYFAEHRDLATAEHHALLDAAAACVAALPDLPGVVHVNVNGHANAGHQPVEGWSDTHLTVTVSQHAGETMKTDDADGDGESGADTAA